MQGSRPKGSERIPTEGHFGGAAEPKKLGSRIPEDPNGARPRDISAGPRSRKNLVDAPIQNAIAGSGDARAENAWRPESAWRKIQCIYRSDRLGQSIVPRRLC